MKLSKIFVILYPDMLFTVGSNLDSQVAIVHSESFACVCTCCSFCGHKKSNALYWRRKSGEDAGPQLRLARDQCLPLVDVGVPLSCRDAVYGSDQLVSVPRRCGSRYTRWRGKEESIFTRRRDLTAQLGGHVVYWTGRRLRRSC